MFTTRFATVSLGLLTVGAALALSACSAPAASSEATPAALFSSATDATIVASFDLTAGQLPENIVSAAGDGVAVTFAASRQIAEISAAGDIDILGTLPAPAAGGTATPVLGFPLATGLAYVDGSYFALYATGEADTTGLWELDGDGEFDLIATLPATGLPNGLAYDEEHDQFLAADSVLSAVYSITLDGEVSTWSDDAALAQDGFLGANGVQLHGGDVYVSNLDAGTILQIDITADGTAGEISVAADDLVGIDDFAFTGREDQIVATLDPSSEVVLVHDGERTTVLTEHDGLSNPTSVLVQEGTIYVPSAAYVTQDNPNLLTAILQP
ncbi:hypothetical protein ACSS7Z_00355 [Microbacterium sp. A82]|uniref:hypothetical protein n=1 Tax=Microbacterium sp. A82 TaxID=3450452 RepID=UPI003F2DEC3D